MPNLFSRWFGAQRRERALRKYAIDDALWRRTLDALPFFGHLDAADRARLRESASLFIAQKEFSTAHELELTDAMIVSIAAQACLPVLNLSLDLYRGWVGVIVYPGEFVIRKTVEDEDGVVHEVEHDASGEAWEGGPVVLSWEDAQMTDGADAYNVVIHEFAHKIDMVNGEADGHPPLFRRWHAPLDAQGWADVFDHAYDHFCAQVDAVPERRWSRFERESLIDPYAADHPSEFFAVCSEALFVTPQAFEAAYPELYRLLARYYRQDPAGMGVLTAPQA
ncbi:membrane protein [Caballeronia arationis]|jgi:Mlc titration factor MtfA (ptsG expression regulator)|uniref:Mlc titration factor MtfA, regulates ptsG expression n=1 Tax=Caballeronia arationis TaxID=1777142 RepID=A0A7Z7IA04_9BURK|nr:M90 family metallopeptidase [Caballeronia arationis]SAK71773.1 membrane protein [Caballeronia arationis]SOE81486.1 Mlc titration factor MtfA, regulates ptsG expression [Caballeronia arationis]